MSQENVEVVRRAAFEVWNAGDMDALRELLDPDVIVRAVKGWPEPGPFVGREAAMRQFEQLRGTWDADAVELIGDFVDAGDRVAARFIWRGAGYGPESNIEAVELHERPDLPDSKIYRGREETKEFWRKTQQLFSEARWEPRDFSDLGYAVVVDVRVVVIGRGSEVPIEADETDVFWFRDGMIVRLQGFPTRDEALEAAGLQA
jgi:ketosteroid isomerase-like protein